ncbi:MAG: precorrin-2 C(20)-methyltransferase [Desulfuromonadaceae bacterium GWB2_53_15]|nr:MAG: precorrin-2 C(20)-methyltransferase [Desulfuromonadales bacterium GWD2_54_10]OHB32971.1 MAG: precorrin-2 C(20)-methyltransferase [Desulfuromonadaceae bacterium GWB2_53_15]
MPTFYAVGVGPGDPELLTRKGERILRQADVIVAPVSNPAEASVALETVSPFLDESRQEIIIHQFPMTSDPARLVPAWQEVAALIAGRVEAGRDVAFITIGDPLFYSTFIYLLRIFQVSYPQIPVEVVPGISSIHASAAQALVPLVEGDERMIVIPATAGVDKIVDALARYETVVLLKVKPVYKDILELLKATGRQGNTVFVERVGSMRQKVLTDFGEISAHSPDYLSLMIVRSSS